MLKIGKVHMIVISLVLVIIMGIVYYFYQNSETEDIEFLEDDLVEEQVNSEVQEVVEEKIVIHIDGQVVSPGIVKLNENARIIDAIEAAGGVTEYADLSKINLAYSLSDGQKVYIPSVNAEEEKEIVIQSSGEALEEEKSESKTYININSASKEELLNLPGIGESIAQRIITYRNQNGKFNKIEDIKNVSGIGESKFNNIKEYIYVK